ncbi:hypothetical protein [Thalassobaculum salexigens]|uniref:hypothetical protein n=1 Tax=Thalassobaculum salexigens TaxID=455360 RepID=UPI0003F8F3CB|nr:hypothetical protein [Thalassobaculum salexigens]
MSQQTAEQTEFTVERLLLDLVAWIAERPRPYTDVLDAWRTSCPRLPVWEEAVDRGYVRRITDGAEGATIHATTAGSDFLARHGRMVRKRGAA